MRAPALLTLAALLAGCVGSPAPGLVSEQGLVAFDVLDAQVTLSREEADGRTLERVDVMIVFAHTGGERAPAGSLVRGVRAMGASGPLFAIEPPLEELAEEMQVGAQHRRTTSFFWVTHAEDASWAREPWTTLRFLVLAPASSPTALEIELDVGGLALPKVRDA